MPGLSGYLCQSKFERLICTYNTSNLTTVLYNVQYRKRLLGSNSVTIFLSWFPPCDVFVCSFSLLLINCILAGVYVVCEMRGWVVNAWCAKDQQRPAARCSHSLGLMNNGKHGWRPSLSSPSLLLVYTVCFDKRLYCYGFQFC